MLDIKFKKIIVYGLGISGISTLKFFARNLINSQIQQYELYATDDNLENIEKAKEIVGNQYEAAGQEDPTEIAENKKGGGDLNRDSYKKQTVLEQPNHLVYSCQQITAPVPMTGCHLGYMGVGWLGGTINAGSGTPAWRGYEKEATLYCTDGIWTFVTDIKSGGHSRARKTRRKARKNNL